MAGGFNFATSNSTGQRLAFLGDRGRHLGNLTGTKRLCHARGRARLMGTFITTFPSLNSGLYGGVTRYLRASRLYTTTGTIDGGGFALDSPRLAPTGGTRTGSGSRFELWGREVGRVTVCRGVGLSGKLCKASGNFLTRLRDVSPSRGCGNASLRNLSTFRHRLGHFSVGIDNGVSDPISGFFTAASDTTLFPRCVSETIEAKLRDTSILSRVVTTGAIVSNLSCHPVASILASSSGTLGRATRNATVPRASIGARRGLMGLGGHNEVLYTSCRTVHFRGLSLFAIALGRVNTCVSHTLFGSTMDILSLNSKGGGPTTALGISSTNGLACSSLISF